MKGKKLPERRCELPRKSYNPLLKQSREKKGFNEGSKYAGDNKQAIMPENTGGSIKSKALIGGKYYFRNKKCIY